MNRIVWGGIDIGSRACKIWLEQETGNSHQILDSIQWYKLLNNSKSLRVEDLLRSLFALSGEIEFHLCATGYGRNAEFLGGIKIIPELTAHSIGAVSQTNLNELIVLDLGGQDTKVLHIEQGMMQDFHTNDKCAAGTGRFLENLSRVLGISLEELSNCFENPLELNSICAIFSETEVISYIAKGESIEHIAAGINYSVVKRIIPMINRFPVLPLVMTGGVAVNKAIIQMLEKELNQYITIPAYPQLNGAIGACKFIRGK